MQLEHTPYPWNRPNHGARHQLTPQADISPHLSAAENKITEKFLGTLLLYTRAVDPSLCVVLVTITPTQTTGSKDTTKNLVQFLNHCSMYPDATILYTSSGMILYTSRDVSYLTESRAWIWSGCHFYLSDKPMAPSTLLPPSWRMLLPLLPSPHVENSSSTAKVLRTILEEMGHTQAPIPMETNNSTAQGMVTSSVRQCCSKAIDMRLLDQRQIKSRTILRLLVTRFKQLVRLLCL